MLFLFFFFSLCFFFFCQAEDGIRDLVRSRGLGDVYKRQDWVYGGVNPFIHTTLFNDFFDVLTDARLDGKSMMDLVSTGGTENWAIKAARDMVAAYLNESAFPGSFPATSLGALEDMWYAAVDDGDAGFEAFHTLVSGWNDPETGICPLP